MSQKERRPGLVDRLRERLRAAVSGSPEQEAALQAGLQRDLEEVAVASLFDIYTNSVANQEQTLANMRRDQETADPFAREVGARMIDNFQRTNERVLTTVEGGLLRTFSPDRSRELRLTTLGVALSHWSARLEQERLPGNQAVITSIMQRLDQRQQELINPASGSQPPQTGQNS